MNLLLSRTLHIPVLIFLIMPLSAIAAPAITCHCFKDRSFDAARPAIADPYFLATTQNSFFALVFNTDKMSIVMKKQQGTSSDDLWIAYWVAKISGGSADALLRARSRNESWRSIVASLRLNSNVAGARFQNALNANAPSDRLSEAVVDDLFTRYRLMGNAELASLRQAGASSQELILATLIAGRLKKSAGSIYGEVKKGAKTWGELIQSARIDTKNMQQEISAILKLQPI